MNDITWPDVAHWLGNVFRFLVFLWSAIGILVVPIWIAVFGGEWLIKMYRKRKRLNKPPAANLPKHLKEIFELKHGFVKTAPPKGKEKA